MVLDLTAINVGLHFIQPNLRAGKTQENVQAMAVKFTDLKPYKKDGCLWLGWYGFKFSDSGLFVGIESGEQHNNKSVCDHDL